MIDFKGGLEKYIEAEVQRCVEERLAKVLEALGVSRVGSRHHASGPARANVPEGPVSLEKQPRSA